GVRGITLDEEDDEVVGMVCVYNLEKDTVLVVSEKGYGKRSAVEDYRITNRGGKGVKTLSITEKTGKLVAIINAIDERDLMIINKSGTAIRTAIADIRIMGRATQGVKLIDIMKRNDEISSVCSVIAEQNEDKVADGIGENLQEEISAMTDTQENTTVAEEITPQDD
ncbi:MAG: DNA gyrase C-terminal beta-propeller domain-containing protein, partial [Segatella copri]